MNAILELAALGGELARIWIAGNEEDKARAQAEAEAAVASMKSLRATTMAAHEKRMAELQAKIDAK